MKEQKEYSNNDKKIVEVDVYAFLQFQKEYLKFGRRDFRRKCQMTMSEAKGITLIALIITIIILLILATVSISILNHSGILTHAKEATNKYDTEQKKEGGVLANALSLMDRYTNNSGNEDEVPAELVAYLVGTNGKSIFELIDMDENSGEIFGFSDTGDANLQLDYINISDGDEGYINIIFMYKDKLYYVSVDGEEYNTKEVKYIGNKTEMPTEIKEGAKLRIDGINYTILYVNNDNTVEIVADAIGDLTLGKKDEKATGNNDFEKAVNSYNNAIERINDYCASLYKDENGNYKNSNIISVRSIGSNRANPYVDTDEMYTDSNISTWNCSYNGTPVTVDRVGKVGDNNYEEDYNKMKELGIETCESSYWLASRSVPVDPQRVFFDVRYVDEYGNLGYYYLVQANCYGKAFEGFLNYCVRPVLKMNISALRSN